MKPLTPDQQVIAQTIQENERVIEQLRRQNDLLARLLPRASKKPLGKITHPITGRVYEYAKNRRRK